MACVVGFNSVPAKLNTGFLVFTGGQVFFEKGKVTY